MTSQCQERHLHLIHLQNHMIENTSRRTPDLANVECRVLLFTEDYVNLDSELSNERFRVHRRRGEHFTDQRVYESDRFGGGSFMVWAGICHDGRTQLKIDQGTLNTVKYRDDSLDPIVLPFLQQRNFDHVLQHDNARCRDSCLSRLSEPESHPYSSLADIITGSVTN